MSKQKNKYSVCRVDSLYEDKDGNIKHITECYLSERDIEKGLDIELDMIGYIISAI